ncbi:hypothetical protein [Micromonospora okii]|uniref:hypothetical protein n=1 Tax=Micromonospora okii TaxID=1182970 RepID=UPI001E28B295|nr:hypothetical protein [Micromonospora okii]
MKELASHLWKRDHKNASSVVEDVNLFATTITSFASSLNDYAYQSGRATKAIELVNLVTNLGTTAVESLSTKEGRSNPWFVAATAASAAVSIGRVAVEFALEEGGTLDKAKFGLDMAQMALQVTKWGTKPSVAKAVGKEYAASMASATASLASDVQEVRARIGTSNTSLRSAQSAPVAGSARPQEWAQAAELKNRKGKGPAR